MTITDERVKEFIKLPCDFSATKLVILGVGVRVILPVGYADPVLFVDNKYVG